MAKIKYPAMIMVLLAVSFTFGGAAAILAYATGNEVVGNAKLYMVSHTEYRFSEPGQIVARLVDFQGNPVVVNNCTATILYPDKSIFVNAALMTESANISGDHYYSFTTPAGPEGVYEYQAECTYAAGAKTASVTNSFHLSSAFTSVLGNLTSVQNDLLNIANNLSAVNASLSAEITSVAGQITTLSSDVGTNFTEVFNRLTEINTTVAAINYSGDFADIQANFSSVLNELSAINSSVSTVISDLSQVQSDVTTINEALACIGPEIIGVMTSNTAPAPLVAYGTGIDPSGPAYLAFDENLATSAEAGFSQNMTVAIDLGAGEARAMNKYEVTFACYGYCGAGSADRNYDDWYVQGSNDNSSWTTLDVQASQFSNFAPFSVNVPVTREYTFSNTEKYRYYQIVMSDPRDGTGSTQSNSGNLFEWEIYEVVGICQLIIDVNESIQNELASFETKLQGNLSTVLTNIQELNTTMNAEFADIQANFSDVFTNFNDLNASMQAGFTNIDGNLSVILSNQDAMNVTIEDTNDVVNSMSGVLNNVNVTTTNTYDYVTGTLATNVNTVLSSLGVINETVNRIETVSNQINDTTTAILQNQEDQVYMTTFSG